MNTNSISIRSSRPGWILLLAALSIVSLMFVWRGAGRMMQMQTQAASHAEFVQLKTDEVTKIVVEVVEPSGGKIHGKLVEKKDETHYARTVNDANVAWGKETAFVMGKAEDVRAGAVVHVTGKIGADRAVQATQIVILTGYVQVK